MIKEKYIPHLAIGSMIFLVILVAVGAIFSSKVVSTEEELVAPEYMTKLFDKSQVLEINIQIDEKDWESAKENAQDENYYQADLTINGETYYNIGIRPKGNSSLSMVASDDTTDRYSFKIKTDKYVSQSIYGLTKFVLNNNIGDATNMKEYLSYDMLSEMGVPTPGYAYAHITINGEEWGLYLAVESLEESFVQRNFGSLDGNLYKVEGMNMGGGGKPGNMPQMGKPGENAPSDETQGDGNAPSNIGQGGGNAPGDIGQGNGNAPNNMEQGGGNAPSDRGQGEATQSADKKQGGGPGGSGNGANLVYSDNELSSYSSIFDYTIFKTTTEEDQYVLINILKNLNEGMHLDECIDVKEVLKYIAVNTFLVNQDSYFSNMKHNFYLYEEDGQLQILPWDYNLSFGAFQMKTASEVINFPIDTPVTDSMETSPLVSKLLEVDEYKELYHSYLQELIDTYISSGKYEETINQVDALISGYVKNDPTAFFTYEEYQASLPNLLLYGEDRTTSILAQLAGEQPADDYGMIETTMDLKAMGQQGGGQGGPGGAGKEGNAGMQPSEQTEQVGNELEQRPDLAGKSEMPSAQGGEANGVLGEGQVESVPMAEAGQASEAQTGNEANHEGLPDAALMEQMIPILQETDSEGNLTEEAKAKLEALGVSETQIQFFKKMTSPGGNPGGPGNMETVNTTEMMAVAAISSVILIGGLVLVLNFKRKKFRSK